MKTITHGVKRISHDRSKDWSYRARFGVIAPEKLPDTLGRVMMPVDDQGMTSFCTAFATSKAIAYHYGIDMSPEWQTAKIGEFNTDGPIFNGADPLQAMYAAVLNGALPKILTDVSLNTKSAQFVADWRNWPANLDEEARKYAPGGFYAVADDPKYDVFDDIRSALYKAWTAGDQFPVMAFGTWYQMWSDAGNRGEALMPVPTQAPIALHAYLFVDWITQGGVPYLVGHLSSGPSFGDKGFLLFSREDINNAFAHMDIDGTGLYMFRMDGRYDSLAAIARMFIYRLQKWIKILSNASFST